MSPEQIRMEPVDGRADVYALGVVLYFALAGKYPFHAKTVEEMEWQHLHMPVPSLAEAANVPPALAQLIARALAKSKDDRPSTATELATAYRAALTPPARTGARTEGGTAVAVCIQVNDPDGNLLSNDDALDALADVFDRVEAELVADEFGFPVRASNVFVAARPLRTDEDPEVIVAAVAERIVPLAREAAQICTAPEGLPCFSVGVGHATLRHGSKGTEVFGGDVLKVERWASLEGAPAVARVQIPRTTRTEPPPAGGSNG
jgi:hypothetical protein